MLESHKPIILDKFNGLFDRGKDNSVPQGYFRDCKNLVFSESGCETRPGTDLSIIIPGVRRIYTYKRPGEASRLLILNDVGEIYDSLNLAAPILTIVGMTDFSMVTFFGRAYISPHNGIEGLPNEVVWVYDGTAIRQAGGTSPSGSLTVATSALSGFVEPGTHLYAVSFETASGYVTKPGPAIYAIHVAPGGFKVDISSIPTGPLGTVARRLLATKVVDPYSGDQNNQEFFFIPEGRIGDNVTTTLTVDFFDADLQASADHLFFQRESIPACLHLSSYKNRMVALNYDGGNSIALVSAASDPEAFSELDGFIVVDPASSDTLRTAIEFRSVLYFFKSFKLTGVSQVEGLEPSEWAPETIDFGVGSEVFGVQRIIDNEGSNDDKFLVATRSGLAIFNGLVQHPDLTWGIEEYWKRVNFNAANKIQVFNDPSSNSLYIALPIDGATLPNIILFGDYSRGFDPINIRWSPWTFPYDDLCITVDVLNGTPYLRIGSLDGNIYNYPSAEYSDAGTGIDSYFETSHLKLDDSSAQLHASALRIHGRGEGLLQASLLNQDVTKSQTLALTTLSEAPGLDYTRRSNFTNERVFIKLRTNLFEEHFEINALSLFVKPIWTMRPQ